MAVVAVPFYPGDGAGAITVNVAYLSDYPRGYDGTCAFCEGDPCAERSAPESNIGAYFTRNRTWAETCPMCLGRPT